MHQLYTKLAHISPNTDNKIKDHAIDIIIDKSSDEMRQPYVQANKPKQII